MAILVNNPSTVQFTGAPTEPQEASVNPLVPGFTEELANAMQPTSQATESANAAKKRLSQGTDAKLNDLQILPPDVLLNAVGEANFAFPATGNQADEDAIAAKDSMAEEAEASLLNALDDSLAAEMAGTALAAQMTAQASAQASAQLSAQTAAQLASQALAVDAKLDSSKLASATDAIVSVGAAGAAAGAQLGGTATLKDAVASTEALSPNASMASMPSGSGGELGSLAVNASNSSLSQAAEEAQANENQIIGSTAFMAEPRPVSGVAQNSASLIQTDALPNNLGSGKSQPLVSSGLISQQASLAMSNGQTRSDLQNAETLQNNLTSEQSQSLLAANLPQSSMVVAKTSGQIDAGIPTGQVKQNSDVALEASVSVSQTGAVDAPVAKVNLDGSQHNVPASGFQTSELEGAQNDLASPGNQGALNELQTGQNLAPKSSFAAVEKDSPGLPESGNMSPDLARNLELNGLESGASTGKTMAQPLQVSSTELNQDTSFKFDAKLGGQLPDEVLSLPANASKPVSLDGLQSSTNPSLLPVAANAPALAPDSAIAPVLAQFKNVDIQTQLRPPLVDADESLALNSPKKGNSTNNVEPEASQLSVASVYSLNRDSLIEKETTVKERSVDSEAVEGLMVANTNAQHLAEENAFVSLTQSESRQPVAMGFSDVASTFVSTLVGGPQRPITTVMDWVALNPHEPPQPVMPHELRLDAGAVQVEIQRMVKQGGGHVVMELTPPDQSKFTIELKLDDKGGAYLRVEGVSDSTKTRLEQSAPQLQEQFQEMGLNLQLDMRQNKDSSSSGAANWTPNEPGFDNAKPQEASVQTTRAVAAEKARNQNGGQVYLYA